MTYSLTTNGPALTADAAALAVAIIQQGGLLPAAASRPSRIDYRLASLAPLLGGATSTRLLAAIQDLGRLQLVLPTPIPLFMIPVLVPPPAYLSGTSAGWVVTSSNGQQWGCADAYGIALDPVILGFVANDPTNSIVTSLISLQTATY